MTTSASPAEVARVRGELQRAPQVKSIQFVSKQQGYEQEKKRNPQAFALIGYNPLPDIFRITPDKPEHSGAVRTELDQSSPLGTRLVTDPAIAAVQNRQAQTDQILSATRVIKITMALLAALLVLASILLISNTIRLSLFSRRREVEVMKLVGATDWFIRWPFVLEGLFLGALGGAAAIGLLALAKVTLVDPLANTVKLISQPDMIAFPLLIAILMACAIAVSAAGSGISLRRFLKV
jgi:cell division transport system permease protein